MLSNEKSQFQDFPQHLLDWYGSAARDLPWRVGPVDRAAGQRPDPYRVWLAEIMLQQTTIPHATRYYRYFTERWPTLAELAAARDEDVMAAWAGLGYYARARNLLKCARQVVALGQWPDTAKALRLLPGIGPYTAGAVAALAFDRVEAAIDGNVDRVFSRLLATAGEWSEEKKRIATLVQSLVPSDRPAEFAEALMDLGATVCLPKSPDCKPCPVRKFCRASRLERPDMFPIKPKKAALPRRAGHVYVLIDRDNRIMTETRPPKGLLGGMLGLPTTVWVQAPARAGPAVDAASPAFPVPADWQKQGEVEHVFTHFSLSLTVGLARVQTLSEHQTTPVDEARASLPSVFAKALGRALDLRG